MTPPDTMREYAIAKTLALMDDWFRPYGIPPRIPREEAVHKLRVAIRRFQQALRLFAAVLKVAGCREDQSQVARDHADRR